jgi:dTDP-glucose pyrophosphorylase
VGEEPFLYICGDNLYSVADLKGMDNGDQYSYVAGMFHKKPEKYGVLVEEDGFLKEIKEKPIEFSGNVINSGLYKFTPEIFEKLGEIKKSSRGEYEITDVITLLAREKKVKVYQIKDYWFDFGNPADIMKLSSFFKNLKNGNSGNKKSD